MVAVTAPESKTPELTVVTLCDANRLAHVRNQAAALHRWAPGARHVVVALNDAGVLQEGLPTSTVVPLGTRTGDDSRERWPLAAARNAAGDTAAAGVADNHPVIFLDADCVPGPDLVRYYLLGLERHPASVSSGPVTYLPRPVAPGDLLDPVALAGLTNPHPARPCPSEGEVRQAGDAEYELFWSLSFALTAGTWRQLRRRFGGFDEKYVGYGGEDTDFAQHLRHHGVELVWVGGAHAFHQWHPVSSPPWEHLDDILLNAAHFHDTWGWWPMEGWLERFAADGAVEFRDGRWRRT